MHLLRYANEWNVPTTHLPEIFLATLKRILKFCDDHKSKFISFKKKWKYFERSSTDFPFFLGHNFEQNPSRWPSSLLSIRNAINAGHRQEKLMCNDRVASRLLLFRVYLGLLATFWVSWLKQSIWLASVPVDQILQRKTCRFTRNFTEFSLLFFFRKKSYSFSPAVIVQKRHMALARGNGHARPLENTSDAYFLECCKMVFVLKAEEIKRMLTRFR